MRIVTPEAGTIGGQATGMIAVVSAYAVPMSRAIPICCVAIRIPAGSITRSLTSARSVAGPIARTRSFSAAKSITRSRTFAAAGSLSCARRCRPLARAGTIVQDLAGRSARCACGNAGANRCAGSRAATRLLEIEEVVQLSL